MVSIPLAMLSSLVVLYFLGETINTMTLGGLALAVGILVDDSTVTIENTYRLLDEEKMPLAAATLHGAAEIAMPTLVSTLAISCVFTSVIFLEGRQNSCSRRSVSPSSSPCSRPMACRGH
jgi:multidrug efflux pump subunit AcrB